ncbi:unnamed protein product [Protopolystoma xenopodis]|uniref:Uncharacterized protein n=1 Tax=Protopolystoma xenopodis TaxID=117903 RepID=A0A3S5BKK2_9PLAT|nr:unnamed protein product [Protopolystoma xenopodis]
MARSSEKATFSVGRRFSAETGPLIKLYGLPLGADKTPHHGHQKEDVCQPVNADLPPPCR